MKTSISSKLFLGFLLVIFLNVLFVVVVSRFADLYGISRMLGWQNDIKNSLLKISSAHASQRTNIVLLDKLKREESYGLLKTGVSTIRAQVDSVEHTLTALHGVDTAIAENQNTWRLHSSRAKLQGIIAGRLTQALTTYEVLIDTLAGRRLTGEPGLRPAPDSLGALIAAASDSLVAALRASERRVDDLTRLRLADIGDRVDNGRTVTMFILAGMSAFALVFAFVFSRMITTALRRLKESALRIGKGELRFNESGYPEDEIGDLARAFARMARDLREAQDELVRSKRLAAIGQIVASVNHEINNPLMIISGNAQLLEMALADRPDDLARVRSIIEEADRISAVTRKLRDIRNPIVESYSSSGEEMINIEKSIVTGTHDTNEH